MNKISQKSLKKYNANRFAACLLAVLMLFSALSTGSMTVHAETTDVARIGETSYTSLDAAINAAGTPTEAVVIDLLADTALTGNVTIDNNITLNLNGKTLDLCNYTLSIDSLGKVVDNSESQTGLLKVADSGKFYSSTQVPVYNTEKGGYVVADIVHQEAKVSEDGADVFKLVFKPDFGATINNLLKTGSTDADVAIEILVSWTGGSQTFVYTDDMVQDAYTNSGRAFYINISNFTNFANVKITPKIVSGLGAECSGTTYTLTQTNGYIKVTENSATNGYKVSGMYGAYLETFGVKTSDTVVMDVALRAEAGLAEVTLKSQPTNGTSTANLLYISNGWIKDSTNKTEIVELSADSWTEIRVVWELASEENNFILYEYSNGVYVERYKTTIKAHATNAPDDIRFQTSKTSGNSLHVDDFAVYTTEVTDYTGAILTPANKLYTPNYDAVCEHGTKTCPGYAVNGGSAYTPIDESVIQRCRNTAHATEIVVVD